MKQAQFSRTFFALIATALLTSGCAAGLDKLDRIGKAPDFAPVEDPTQKAGYRPMTWPTPETPSNSKQYANSLWQPGARAFFRDQRAARVGDLIRVNIEIQDQAQLNNQTRRERKTNEEVGAPDVFGMEDKLFKMLPGVANSDSLVDLSNNNKSEGTGLINRQERIRTQVAATVTQVLPNGNLVIDGKQEVTVNYDLREISIKGIIRREDINSDNTIDISQIAEARVAYGGRGQVMDIQQSRWGWQAIEALSPF